MVSQERRDQFVAALRTLGGSAGNGRLREHLQWEDDQYRAVHAALIQEGKITAGRGRGGSVSLSAAWPAAPNQPDVPTPAAPAPLPPENPVPPPSRAVVPTPPPKREPPSSNSQASLSALIWSVADLLRGDYKPHEYGRVILPFTVLRRLDCVLAPSKPAVLKELAEREAQGINPEPFLLRVAKLPFVNTSTLDMRTLIGDQDNLAMNLATASCSATRSCACRNAACCIRSPRNSPISTCTPIG